MRLFCLLSFSFLICTEAHSNLRRLGRGSSRGRGPIAFSGGNSTDSSPNNGARAPRDRINRFNTNSSQSGESGVSRAPGLGSGPPGAQVDLGQGSAGIPGMELAPPNTEIGQGPIAFGNTGDIQDDPNIDGDIPQDLPAPDIPQDLPPPEDGFASFTPPAGDAQDSPGNDGGPEIPGMEPIPESILGSDTRNGELPPAQDGFLSFAPPPGDARDSPGNDGGVDIPQMEPIPEVDTPIILPFGGEAETYMLQESASVCAPTIAAAQRMCANLPICKYPMHRDGTIAQLIVQGQGDCVRRCDSPLTEGHCALSHEKCFHFVGGCNCPRLTNDGGECQPY